jgi:hypothetical protein
MYAIPPSAYSVSFVLAVFRLSLDESKPTPIVISLAPVVFMSATDEVT